MKQSIKGLMFGLAVCVSFVARGQESQCTSKPSREDALDWPDRHAWNLFVSLNHPAIDKKVRRGVPDCTKKVGTPGATAVWESWRNAHSEVFTPTEPPEWDDNTLPDEKPGKVPGPALASVVPYAPNPSKASLPQGERSFHGARTKPMMEPFFSPGTPAEPDGIFDGAGGFGETRMNKVTYEFIRDQCLYNRQGTERYALAIVDKKKPSISLPVGSIEVKAAWIDFEREGIDAEKRSTYYTAEYKDKKYGLVALHVITKDIPNWFWATFHHKDSPKNEWEGRDTFGRPKVLDGTVWENYVLGGTQTDFVNATGQRTILSDHHVEFGFQKSSCISCHATATISVKSAPGAVGMPRGQQRALCLLDPAAAFGEDAKTECPKWAGAHLYNSDGALLEERGTPEPKWYVENNTPAYFQTDFLYSIPFRARRVEEQGAPPSRCVW